MSLNHLRIAGAFIILFLWLQNPVGGQTLNDIHKAIKKNRAAWRAGETSLTRLSPEQQKKRVGLILPAGTGREPMLSLEKSLSAEIPPSLDWRDHSGNFVTPVKNQGGCGSCWAFAAAAVLESITLISDQTPDLNLDLSEQVLLSCGDSGTCVGGYVEMASDFLRDTGLPLESCYSYTGQDGSCANACPGWNSDPYKIAAWNYVTTTHPAVEIIKGALYEKGPLVTSMAVYRDLFSYVGGVYSYVNGNFIGYHSVVIIGYDDAGQYFLVKNSWGTGWGEAGLFRIAYSELNGVTEFGNWTIAYTPLKLPCSYRVGLPSPASFPASGGKGSVPLQTANPCAWAAGTVEDWISFPAGNTGTGSANLQFSVSANYGGSKTGFFVVGGQRVSLSQEGRLCAFTLSPSQQNFGSRGGSGSVGITAQNGCSWAAQSNTDWLIITAGGTGAGSGTVVYSVAPNGSSSTRTGSLTIAGQTFTVTQEGSSLSACTYSLSSSGQAFDASGGAGGFNVTVTGGYFCNFMATSNAPWITGIISFVADAGGRVTYFVAPNDGISPRTATINVAGKAFTVIQQGK